MAVTDDRCSNPTSRIGHVIFITAYALVLACALVSLVMFVLTHNDIQNDLPESSSGDCILYVTDDQADDNNIGGGGFCRYAIYGAVAVGIGATICMVMFILKCVVGVQLLSCILLVELPLLFCIMAISLSHSLNTTIGLALTCRAFADSDNFEGSSCKDFEAPGGTKFFCNILISEAISWAATGTLMILFVIYVIMSVVYWRKATRPNRSKI